MTDLAEAVKVIERIRRHAERCDISHRDIIIEIAGEADAFLSSVKAETDPAPATPEPEPSKPRRDAKGNIIPWAKEHDYFMAFDPENPDVPTD